MTTIYQSQISESLCSFCLNPSSGLTSPQLKKACIGYEQHIWATHTSCLTPWFAHGDKELKEPWDTIDKTAAPSLHCAHKLHKHSHWKRNPWGAIVWGTHSSGSMRKQWEILLCSRSWSSVIVTELLSEWAAPTAFSHYETICLFNLKRGWLIEAIYICISYGNFNSKIAKHQIKISIIVMLTDLWL